MVLTPSTVRLDLKCGRGSISPGEKCHVAQASPATPDQRPSTKGIGNKLKVAGEVAAKIGGGTAIGIGVLQTVGGTLSGNLGYTARGVRNVKLGNAAIQTAAASQASRAGNKGLTRHFLKKAGQQAALGVGQEALLGAGAAALRAARRSTTAANQRSELPEIGTGQYMRQRAKTAGRNVRTNLSNALLRSRPGTRRYAGGRNWSALAKRDSAWAVGFSPEPETLEI